MAESSEQETGTSVQSTVAGYAARPVSAWAGTTDRWLLVLRDFGVEGKTSAGGTLRQVRDALRAGLPRSAFDRLRGELGVSSEELAGILGIPKRTLARRVDRFKPDESERILRVAGVVRKALEVLEDPEGARRWMTTPRTALGGLTPLGCCDTDLGAREVEALLGRIEHGVFT